MPRTLEDLKAAKRQLEHTILSGIRNFEERFNVTVARVDTDLSQTMGGSCPQTATARIEVRL